MSNARPGGELATRPLYFIWIVDCSGSMANDGKIQSLNQAVRDTLPTIQQVAKENPNASVQMRVLAFSSGAQWIVSQPTPVDKFQWSDLQAGGVTDMGKAFMMLAEQLSIPPMPPRALPPVLVLFSDGQPTDDYKTGLKTLFGQPWSRKAVRLAIAIGDDADLDVLSSFIDHVEIKPLVASNAETLTRYIKWASTAVLAATSSPPSQSKDAQPDTNTVIPPPPLPVGDAVW